MKYIKIILLFIITLSIFQCGSKSSITEKMPKNDFDIINTFVKEYSNMPFFKERQFFYLKSELDNEFKKYCLGSLKSKVLRFKNADSLCKTNTFPVIDSLGASYICLIAKKNSIYSTLLSEVEYNYFESLTENKNEKKNKISNHTFKDDYAKIVDNFPDLNSNNSIIHTVSLGGPFYNKQEDIAFLQVTSGRITDQISSLNCLIYIKENDNWKLFGSANVGI